MAATWERMGTRLPRVVSVASSATPTPNADTTDMYIITALAEAALFGAPTGTPKNGQKLLIRIKDNATGRALTWNAIYAGDLLPSTTVAGVTLYVVCLYNEAASKWDAAVSDESADVANSAAASTADSKAVSAVSYASSADTSVVTVVSVADSTLTSSVSVADSKAVSAAAAGGGGDPGAWLVSQIFS